MEMFRRKISDETKSLLEALEDVHRIARQTTMLSLNVSIEAARVGELGAGFTVIGKDICKLASEVQLLADNLYARVDGLMISIGDSLMAQSSARERHHRETSERIAGFLTKLSADLKQILQQQVFDYQAEPHRPGRERKRTARRADHGHDEPFPVPGHRAPARGAAHHDFLGGRRAYRHVARQAERGRRSFGAEETLAGVLEELSRKYVSEEQRDIHRIARGGAAANVKAAAPNIELF